MKLNKDAYGVIRKVGDVEIAVAVNKDNPEDIEFFIKTKIKKKSAQEYLDDA